MSQIQIKNLSFRYDNGIENIFDDVSVNLDTNWKLGLIGRNGKGKTTLLQILSGKLKYDGIIIKNVAIDYFPFKVDENKLTIEVLQDFCMAEDWEIIKELNILNFNIEALYRTYKTLSGGEKVKAMLVALFLKENNFLLIDEPTNHLDDVSRLDVEKYLKNKKGFILVSHDRGLLNEVTDHIMAINNSNIDIIQGNYSVWKEAFDRQNNFELKQNEKLGKEIKKLENANLSSYISGVLSSEDAGITKPSKIFFDSLFQMMHYPNKEEALMIGDGITTDILGGMQYGIDTCLFNPNNNQIPVDCKPTMSVQNLLELKRKL